MVQAQPTKGALGIPVFSSGNPTHGSGWIVQVQPTQGRTRDSGFLLRESHNGSRWFVEVQPTEGCTRESHFSSPVLHSRREERDTKKQKEPAACPVGRT